MLSFEITGDTDLAKALQGIPGRISEDAAFAALVEALLPVVNAAKARAPVETGGLRRSMGFIVRRYGKSKILLGVVGPLRGYGVGDSEPANYAHLVEFGHRIAKGGKLDRIDKRSVRRGIFEARGTDGGFVPPRPFMRPAWDETKRQCLETMAQIFGRELLAAVRRRKQSRRKAQAVDASGQPVTTAAPTTVAP